MVHPQRGYIHGRRRYKTPLNKDDEDTKFEHALRKKPSSYRNLTQRALPKISQESYSKAKQGEAISKTLEVGYK